MRGGASSIGWSSSSAGAGSSAGGAGVGCGGGEIAGGASRARCRRFADVLGVGRVGGAGTGVGAGGDVSTGEVASASSSATGSATGMMKPKSTSPTLCLLEPASIGGGREGTERKHIPSPAHAVSHAIVSCTVSARRSGELGQRKQWEVHILVAIVSWLGAATGDYGDSIVMKASGRATAADLLELGGSWQMTRPGAGRRDN